MYTKSQVGYISPIWGSRPLSTNFHENWLVEVDDVIIQSNFVFNTFRVSDLQGVEISVFPLTLLVIVTTVLPLHGQAPRYLADHLITSSDVTSRLRLCSANRHQLIVPRCRLNTYGRLAFSIVSPLVWISLPGELRYPVCGPDSFKQFLKTIPFNLY